MAVHLFEATLLIVAALFPIVNPLGGAVIFLGLTEGAALPVREALVWRVSRNSFFILLLAMLIGAQVLAFFGVSVPVVQIGGGLVVIALGWKMLHSDSTQPDSSARRAADLSSRGFYPLTFPLTIDPGSIAVAIALGANTQPHPYGWITGWVSTVLGPLVIAASIFLCFRFAERVEKFLGPAAMNAFLRMSAFIIICIGIQLIWNGVAALIHFHA